MNFKNGKQIVRYNAGESVFIELGKRAAVYALDHPRLGEQYVFTSEVTEIFTTGDGIQAFETLNTIYKLDSYMIPE